MINLKETTLKAVIGGVVYLIILYFLNHDVFIYGAYTSSFFIGTIITFIAIYISDIFKFKFRKDILSGMFGGLLAIIYNIWGTYIVELNYAVFGVGHTIEYFAIYFATGFIVVFLAVLIYNNIFRKYLW